MTILPYTASVTAFRGPQVCRLAGVTYRQLDYWARTNLIVPSVMDANGSGSQRLYGMRDLIELVVVKQTLDAGLALGMARRVVASLREVSDAHLGEVRILFQSGREEVLLTDETLLEHLRDAEPVSVMIDMDRLIRLVAAREADLLVST